MDARPFITFHPKTVSSESSQPDPTALLARSVKGNVENPKAGSVPPTTEISVGC